MSDTPTQEMRDLIATHLAERGVTRCPKGRALGAELCGDYTRTEQNEIEAYTPHDERPLPNGSLPWSDWHDGHFVISMGTQSGRWTRTETPLGKIGNEVRIQPELGKGFAQFFARDSLDE
ncbi:MAG: hypothetical protein COA62_15860 [Rhodobiaceae bacterium]|nr:MAG: hypothetical protein COA62_15860 [Rhodobiaceae bacterium]